MAEEVARGGARPSHLLQGLLQVTPPAQGHLVRPGEGRAGGQVGGGGEGAPGHLPPPGGPGGHPQGLEGAGGKIHKLLAKFVLLAIKEDFGIKLLMETI